MKQCAEGRRLVDDFRAGTGLSRGVLHWLSREAERRPELVPIHQALGPSAKRHAATLRGGNAAKTASPAVPGSETVRQKANSLVLRAAQAYLAASKGAGFVMGHPAERAVREAMFFLVWSCPQPVVSAALREFACVIDEI